MGPGGGTGGFACQRAKLAGPAARNDGEDRRIASPTALREGFRRCHNMEMGIEETRGDAGLCADCRLARLIRSDRGTIFYQCGKSFEDPRFTRYPRLPVRACAGHEPLAKAG
jgi:hypothetical protein